MDIPIPADVRQIAVICPSWVGDAVMATCVYRALRDACPDAEITAMMRPGIDALLRGGPWFDEVIPCSLKGASGPFRAATLLRKRKPDAIVLLPNSFRSALTARLSAARIRIGYDRDGRGALLTRRLAVPRSNTPTPTVEYYAQLGAFAIGRDTIDTHMDLPVTDQERADADRLLVDVPAETALVLLNPGANRSAKRWPAARFAAVADRLQERHGVTIAITGSPDERNVLDNVKRAARTQVIDLAERGITLGSLKPVLQRAALLITNDTGPRHVAAALGTPTVALFGPTDHRWTTLPAIHAQHERIIVAEPFLPEVSIADCVPRLCAIDRITIGDVATAAEALLAAGHESAA